MRLNTVLCPLLLGGVARAFPQHNPMFPRLDGILAPGCGTSEAPQSVRDSIAAIQELHDSSHGVSAARDTQAETVEVTVHMHASLYSNSPDDHVSEEKLKEQFEILRSAYEPYDIILTLGSITRELNDSIAAMSYTVDGGSIGGSTPAVEDYWRRTRTGDYKTLHVYFYETFPSFIGICQLPRAGVSASKFYLDGCHIVIDALPGSSDDLFNQGKAAIHEVGHWFGLFHVFSGGCNDGDMVDDTPAQLQSPFSCAEERDSCPDQPGVDSIHNFMDYVGDECWLEFTPGQKQRMHDVFNNIRSAN